MPEKKNVLTVNIVSCFFFAFQIHFVIYFCIMQINNEVINNDGMYVLLTIPMRLVVAMVTSLVSMTCVCEHQFKMDICTLTN